MKYNKGFAPLVLIAIIIGALVIGGGVYYLNISLNNKKEAKIEKNNPSQYSNNNISEKTSDKAPMTNTNLDANVSDNIINTNEIKGNIISKNNWGVSLEKGSNWAILKNDDKEIILKSLSGEWSGDIITISYIIEKVITDKNMTTLNSYTYYYDDNQKSWMTKNTINLGDSQKISLMETNPIKITPPSHINEFPIFNGIEVPKTYFVALSHTSFLKLTKTGKTGFKKGQPLVDLLYTIKKIQLSFLSLQ